MWNLFWNLFYAIVYALTSIGLAYCSIASLGMIGGVPGSAKLMYLLLVGFGGYAAVLTAERSLLLFRAAFQRESEAGDQPTAPSGKTESK